jgi:hypothetical protein
MGKGKAGHMDMLSELLGIIAFTFFVIAGWLGSKSYYGYTRYIPGHPLDSVENRYAWGEAMWHGETSEWVRLHQLSGLLLGLSALSLASLFALHGTLDGAIAFGGMSFIILFGTALNWARHWLRSH